MINAHVRSRTENVFVTLARNSLTHAIEYAEHAKLRYDSLLKPRGPTVYFSSAVTPKVLTLNLPPGRLCRFKKCKYGDECSRMHGEDDPRFVNGIAKPEYAAGIKKSIAAWKLKKPAADQKK